MKMLIVLVSLLSASAYSQSATDLINKVALEKKTALATFFSTPYREKEYVAVKKYFVALKDYGVELSESGRSRRRINKLLSPESVGSFCQNIFLTKNEWEQLKKNCTKSGFFLCSDDVLEFPVYKNAIREQLNEQNQKSFDVAVQCK